LTISINGDEPLPPLDELEDEPPSEPAVALLPDVPEPLELSEDELPLAAAAAPVDPAVIASPADTLASETIVPPIGA
jgi:hypothetical protein